MSDPTATKDPVEHEQWMLQVSVKTRAGALINIRGKDASDLEVNLKEMFALVESVHELEQEFLGGAPVGLPAQPVAPPAAGGVPTPPNAPNCEHGLPAKYVKGGVSKAGRPYSAFWACAQPRESQCSFRQTA
jgi:hypothetical protein